MRMSPRTSPAADAAKQSRHTRRLSLRVILHNVRTWGTLIMCNPDACESKASDSRNQWHELIQCGILPQTVQGLQTDLVHLMRSYPRQADGATPKLPAWREITSPTQHSLPGANRLVSALGTNLKPLSGALSLVLAPAII